MLGFKSQPKTFNKLSGKILAAPEGEKSYRGARTLEFSYTDLIISWNVYFIYV